MQPTPSPTSTTCPRCRLINPPEAERCDCGYDFKSATVQSSYLSPKSIRQSATDQARKNVLHGLFWLIGGITITIATYSAASTYGGTYVVAYGAIIWGAVQFLRGCLQSADRPK